MTKAFTSKIVSRLAEFTADIEEVWPDLEKLRERGYRITKACYVCGEQKESLRQCPTCQESMCDECYDKDVPEGDQCGNCEYPDG